MASVCLMLSRSLVQALIFLNNKEHKDTDRVPITIASSVGEVHEQAEVISVVSATPVSPKKKNNLKTYVSRKKKSFKSVEPILNISPTPKVEEPTIE